MECRKEPGSSRHRAVEDAIRLDALVDSILADLPIDEAALPRRLRDLVALAYVLASYRSPGLHADER